MRPFAHATIGDANPRATDTLTITLGGAGGKLTDGTGFSNLTTVGAGVCRLSGTAAAITGIGLTGPPPIKVFPFIFQIAACPLLFSQRMSEGESPTVGTISLSITVVVVSTTWPARPNR